MTQQQQAAEFGSSVKTATGWRFGATLQGQFHPLGYCVHCDGHASAADAAAHYEQFRYDKRGVELVRAAAELERAGLGIAGFGTTTRSVLGGEQAQPAERICIVCGTVFSLDPAVAARWQSWHCDPCKERAAAAELERRAQERRARGWAVWENCGVPDRFVGESFATFRTAGRDRSVVAALEIAQDWAESFDPSNPRGQRGLLIHGPVGTGKTHLAAALARRVVERLLPTAAEMAAVIQGEWDRRDWDFEHLTREGVLSLTNPLTPAIERFGLRFVVAPEFLVQLTEARFHREGQPGELTLYQQAISRTLLVIDELGRVARPSHREQQPEMWYELFNGRYNNRLPTIVTTNRSRAELEDVVGEAVCDRLVEMFDFVPLAGESYRLTKRGQ